MTAMHRFRAGVIAFIGILFLEVGVVLGDVWEISSWSTRTYYRYNFGIEVKGTGLVRITAVDSYELFLNGKAVGSDTIWATVEGYTVTLEKGDNKIAVVVENYGAGNGTGLMFEVEFGDQYFVSDVTERWYWTAEPPADNSWLTKDVSNDNKWQRVQFGTLDRGQVLGFKNLGIQAIAGFPGGVDVGQNMDGTLQLRQVSGENLAAGTFAEPPEAADGSLKTSWSLGVGAINEFARIDLGRRVKIDRVRVITEGTKAEDYKKNSLRGYSVQVSDDRFRWSEVAALYGITDYKETEVTFPSVETRHIRVVVAEVERGQAPRVSEIEVYGTGYARESQYVSEPLNFGYANVPKNFGEVVWDADVPDRTSLTFQFRTAGADMVWSDWSVPYDKSEVFFDVPEPGVFFQYRANLSTSDDRYTPVLRSLEFQFDREPIAVRSAKGSIEPNQIPMGRDTTFTYRLDLSFSGGDAGVEKVAIDVPGLTDVTGPLGGLEGTAIEVSSSFDWGSQRLIVTFSPPIGPADGISTISIPFTTAQYITHFDYRAHLFAPGDSNPLNTFENIGIDDLTGKARSWSVSVSEVLNDVLIRVKANPKVISPNEDGRSDYTVIEFVITKVSEPRDVEIRLFDLRGRLVCTLQGRSLTAGMYLHPLDNSLAINAPGYWDGADDNGELLPPGIYIYQIKVDLEGSSDAIESGTVALAY